MPPPGGNYKDTKTSSRGYGEASSSSGNKGPTGGMQGGTGSGGPSRTSPSSNSSPSKSSTSGGGGPSGGMQGGSGSGGSSRTSPSSNSSGDRATNSTSNNSGGRGPSGGMMGGSDSGGSVRSAPSSSASNSGGGNSPTGARGPLGPDGKPKSDFGYNRSWADYDLRGPTGPAGEPKGTPTAYGNATQAAQVVRGNYPNIAARVDQTTLARTLDTFARALPGEANIARFGPAGMPDLARVGINQMVRNISPNNMLAGMDTTGMRPATAGMNLPGPASMGMVEQNGPLHNLASVAMMNGVLGQGVSPQAMNATNFVAAGTPMVRGVNEVGAPVNGTQFGVDPTGGAAVQRRNSVAQNVLDGLMKEQAGISSVASGQGINVAPAGGVQGQAKQFYDRVPGSTELGPTIDPNGLRGFMDQVRPGLNPNLHLDTPQAPGAPFGPSKPVAMRDDQTFIVGLENFDIPGEEQAPPEGGWSTLGAAIQAGKSIYNNAPRVAATIKDQAIANTKAAVARDPLTALGHWLSMPGGLGNGVGRPAPMGGDRAYIKPETAIPEPAAPPAPAAPAPQAPGIAALWGWQQSPQDWPYGSMPIFGNWRS